MYNILNKTDVQPTGQNKGMRKFILPNKEWKKIYTYSFNAIEYPDIQWF